ncbi:TonB-dependent receptor plug domain-containing protein [Daejeonella oryzae]|uniref:TonB-dependent receptor plug domain-containing protein n=1 Tax=Daejeonella oryzae TaxID=1122943 RepID=UPI0003F55FCD|nr:TonB-dependent receptor plug domain-containing protein [Daejeonella oryzae]
MQIRSLFVISLFAVFLTLGFIQDDEPLKKILAQLEKYRTEHPQEKVHIHLDKPYYAIGDNIWFKAYVMNAEHHDLSGLSKILYVELINDKDSVKQSLRLPLVAGLAFGDFALSDSLREGNYRIRAYTTLMRNYGEEYFFDKTILIGNSISNNVFTQVKNSYFKEGASEKVKSEIRYTDLNGKPWANKEVLYNVQLDFRNIAKSKGKTDENGILNIQFSNNQPFILKSGKIFTSIKIDSLRTVSKVIPVKSTSQDVDIYFFPESGNLIYGVRSKVAFKAVSADGLGVVVSGYVSDKNNNKVAELKSEHAGMGVFGLLPEKDNIYKATIIFEDGSEKLVDLPTVHSTGYVLSINNISSENLVVKIAASPSVTPDDSITLVAQSNGVVKYVSKGKMESRVLSTSIPKTRFETGIVQFTIFNSRNEALAERLVFISHPNDLNIQIKSPELTEKREKVKLAVNVTDASGKPAIGSFSMSVLDESKVPFNENDEVTILSNILLSSELKGFIEKPNYYFSGADEERKRHLDILMLTQGWRRFVWKNLIADAFPSVVYKPEQSMQISGKVTAPNGNPVAGGKVTLFSSIGEIFLAETVTNPDGEFNFENLNFNDSTKFVIQARNLKDRKNVRIELDVLPPQVVTKNKNAAAIEVNLNQNLNSYLNHSLNQYKELSKYGLIRKSIILSEVKIVEKKPLVKTSSNLNGAGNADFIITAKDLEYANDITQFIQGRVPGVIVRNGIIYSARNLTSSFSGPVPMQIVIDGMFVEPQYLSSINPRDVETIEVLKSGFNTSIYGLRGSGGLLIISTKRGKQNLSYASYAQGIISYNPKGFYQGKEFYSPNYFDPKTNTQMLDLRSTIYWNPMVNTDSSGKASVEFYNADSPGYYKVILEGITSEGKIGRTIYRYQVK